MLGRSLEVPGLGRSGHMLEPVGLEVLRGIWSDVGQVCFYSTFCLFCICVSIDLVACLVRFSWAGAGQKLVRSWAEAGQIQTF